MSEDASSTRTTSSADVDLTLLWGTWELWCDLAPLAQGSSAAGDGFPPNTSAATRATALGGSEKQNWLSQVKSIGLFDSAEGFWGLFNCILLPSQLPPNSSYYLFRKHIAPMWEHEANRRGGKWVIPFAHVVTAPDAVEPGAEGTLAVDVAWQKLCMAVIGEQLPGEEMEICGVTVSRGKQRAGSAYGEWKLCLWTRTANKEDVQLVVARFVRNLLDLGSRSGPSCSPTPSPSKLSNDPAPTIDDRERECTTMTFVAHRALMEAKQQFTKGNHSTQPFRPLYTL